MVNLNRTSRKYNGLRDSYPDAAFLNAEDYLFFGILSNNTEYKCGYNPTATSVANPSVDVCLPHSSAPDLNGTGGAGCGRNCNGLRDTNWCTVNFSNNPILYNGYCGLMTTDDCTGYQQDLVCVPVNPAPVASITCNASGTSLTVNWTSIPSAQDYILRVDGDPADSAQCKNTAVPPVDVGWLCNDPARCNTGKTCDDTATIQTGNSFTRNSIQGRRYTASVQARYPGPVNGGRSADVTVTCSSPPPTTTPSITPSPTLPAWMVTQGGDVFVQAGVTFGSKFLQETLEKITFINNGNINSQSGLNLHGRIPYFATYNYIQAAEITTTCNNCSGASYLGGAPGGVPKKYFNNTTYNDTNDSIDNGQGWYIRLRNKLINGNFIDQTINAADLNPNIAAQGAVATSPINLSTAFTDTDNNGFYVIDIQGILQIGRYHRCDKKFVFLVSDSMQITPDLFIGDSSSGCIFITNNSTIINNGGVTPRDGTGGNISYDIVNAFLITDSFQDFKDANLQDTEGLIIKGGLITRTNAFNRNVSLRTSLSPAELFVFDSRYIVLFGKLLDEPIDFTLQEKLFLETLNNP